MIVFLAELGLIIAVNAICGVFIVGALSDIASELKRIGRNMKKTEAEE